MSYPDPCQFAPHTLKAEVIVKWHHIFIPLYQDSPNRGEIRKPRALQPWELTSAKNESPEGGEIPGMHQSSDELGNLAPLGLT